MKKTKLLIPALTVASVGAVVAPMMTMTSCNKEKVFISTDDIAFTGEQHKAVTGGWTIAEATNDYLKQPLQHLGDDTLYGLAYLAKTELAEIKENSYYKNAKITSFHASLSNASASEKTAKVNYQTIANKDAIKGLLVSGIIRAKYTISYDYVLDDEQKQIYKNIHIDDTYEYSFKLVDCFAFITLNLIPDGDSYKNGFALNLFGAKAASENWSIINDWKCATTYTDTLKDDSVVVETDVETEHNFHNAKTQSDDVPIISSSSGLYEIAYLPSTYLSKVTWKGENLPMGYRTDVEHWDDGEQKYVKDPGYYGTPLMLEKGKTYVFYADIKATDNLNAIALINGGSGTFQKMDVTKMVVGSTDTGWTENTQAGETQYVWYGTPITKDGRFEITFKLTDDVSEPIMCIPYLLHYDA